MLGLLKGNSTNNNRAVDLAEAVNNSNRVAEAVDATPHPITRRVDEVEVALGWVVEAEAPH